MARARTQTVDIPRDQWSEFLDGLSRERRGDTVTVQFTDPELGYQVEMRQLPLVGVSADLRAGGGPRIEVIVGRTDFDHTTHSVFEPKAVRVQQDDQGELTVLELESGNGAKTLLMLRPAAFGEAGEIVERP